MLKKLTLIDSNLKNREIQGYPCILLFNNFIWLVWNKEGGGGRLFQWVFALVPNNHPLNVFTQKIIHRCIQNILYWECSEKRQKHKMIFTLKLLKFFMLRLYEKLVYKVNYLGEEWKLFRIMSAKKTTHSYEKAIQWKFSCVTHYDNSSVNKLQQRPYGTNETKYKNKKYQLTKRRNQCQHTL